MSGQANRSGLRVISIIAALVIVVAGLVGWQVASRTMVKQSDSTSVSNQSNNFDNATSPVSWQFDGSAWRATGRVPECADPLTMPSPVDLSKATAVLYPGQTRGGNYKSHGGFIFKGSANDAITVKAPLDAAIYKGSRYIEQGETQYFFVFINPCGITYRFDHLLTLSPELQKVADTLPAPKENDSSTTNFNPAPTVKAGDVVATAVGFKNANNTSVDFGVYDLRRKNAASQTAAWQQAHPNEHEFGAYGICWLDNLSAGDQARARALPGGDMIADKQSDYCK